MKEKKIKKKHLYKIPAVILSVLVLVSALAVSAFAADAENRDIISITIDENGVTPSANSMLAPECLFADIRFDEEIGKHVLSFGFGPENVVRFVYKDNAEAINAIQDSFSLETYLRVDEVPLVGKSEALIGAAHNNTGFRLDIANGEAWGVYFKFSIGTGERYVTLQAPVADVEVYNHIVVTYVGNQVVFYLNGKKVDSANSDLKFHPNTAYYKIYMGADVNGGGKDEAHSACSIAHFSMTPAVFTAEQVAERAANFDGSGVASDKGFVSSVTTAVVQSVGVFLKGMGSTVVDFFENVVLTTNAEGQRTLSTYAVWTLAFVGFGFGAGFLRKLVKKAE